MIIVKIAIQVISTQERVKIQNFEKEGNNCPRNLTKNSSTRLEFKLE